jgi:hypothetical protein
VLAACGLDQEKQAQRYSHIDKATKLAADEVSNAIAGWL